MAFPEKLKKCRGQNENINDTFRDTVLRQPYSQYCTVLIMVFGKKRVKDKGVSERPRNFIRPLGNV
jgi:hypothetical protein